MSLVNTNKNNNCTSLAHTSQFRPEFLGQFNEVHTNLYQKSISEVRNWWPGLQSTFQFIPRVLNWVEVREANLGKKCLHETSFIGTKGPSQNSEKPPQITIPPRDCILLASAKPRFIHQTDKYSDSVFITPENTFPLPQSPVAACITCLQLMLGIAHNSNLRLLQDYFKSLYINHTGLPMINTCINDVFLMMILPGLMESSGFSEPVDPSKAVSMRRMAPGFVNGILFTVPASPFTQRPFFYLQKERCQH